MTVEKITRRELAQLLEGNTYSSAAAELLAGSDPVEATAYIGDREPPYDDGEGRWVADVPAALREGRLIVTD